MSDAYVRRTAANLFDVPRNFHFDSVCVDTRRLQGTERQQPAFLGEQTNFRPTNVQLDRKLRKAGLFAKPYLYRSFVCETQLTELVKNRGRLR